MEPDDFLTKVASKCISEISEAISTGAQWEIACHAYLALQLKKTYNNVPLREAKYSNLSQTIGGNEACDLVFADPTNKTVHIWLEIKVESATNAGQFAGSSLASVTSLTHANPDWVKLKSLPDTFTVTFGDQHQHVSEPITVKRWIMVVAYSAKAKQTLGGLTGSQLSSGSILMWLRDIDAQ